MAKQNRKSRKLKTAEQLQAEADQRKRIKLVTIGADGPERGGLPEHQVSGDRVHDFDEHGLTIRRLYPSIVDRWFAEGGPGFDEPQARAVKHCRELWHAIGDQGKLVANWDGIGGGSSGPRPRLWERAEAFCQLAKYQKDIPLAYWMVFENVVRHEMAAGTAGSHLAKNPAQAIAAARTTVGFVSSKIAEWRGY